MKRTIIFVICVLLLVMVVIFLNINSNSEISKNTQKIEERLLNYGEYRIGKVEDIINIEYDKAYSITSEKNKEEIETYIGIESNKIKSNHNNEMNIIFIKDNKIVAYLQGEKMKKGYYIYLPEGEYLKEELKDKNYTAKADNEYIYYEIEK